MYFTKNQLIRYAVHRTGGREIATISNSCTIPMSNIFRKIRQSDELFHTVFFYRLAVKKKDWKLQKPIKRKFELFQLKR